MDKTAVVILSGGMDSTTALYWAIKQEEGDASAIMAVSFDYGQRHKKELQYAQAHCEDLGVDHFRIDITDINKLVGGSALTDDIEVPEGHYSDDNMAITVVPNRNAIMANIGIGAAVASGAEYLVLGVHAGDHAVYPDCRPIFVRHLETTAHVANEGFISPLFSIATPFINATKADIVTTGVGLGVKWTKTWTCYKGGKIHCGRCATCVERLEAFDIAGFEDPTQYEDRDFWRSVCGRV
jgi:7-cyano-7-deazaguanine synthase